MSNHLPTTTHVQPLVVRISSLIADWRKTEASLRTGGEHEVAESLSVCQQMLRETVEEYLRDVNAAAAPIELFPSASVTTVSPRLAWIKKHAIRTYKNQLVDIAVDRQWIALSVDFGPGIHAYGATEDEALAALATTHGIKLWNEE